MAKVIKKIKMNSAGAVALLKDPGVQADLRQRAEAIQGAMPEGEWEVNAYLGHDRAQATVRAADHDARAAAADMPARVVQALDAGR